MHNAIQQAGEVDIQPIDWVEFNSAGRLLIIGAAEQIKVVVPQLTVMNILVVCLNNPENIELDSTQVVQEKIQLIEGWIGQFKINFEVRQLTADLILDLSDQPVLTTRVLPLGYFASRGNQQILAEHIRQLPELIGTFDKPQYFKYNASICAHSQRQLIGCQQCLDACPADAIISSGDTVTVNPYLCQGCGSCTTVCPSGAMMYALPSLDISINRLRKMLLSWFELQTKAPHILIHDLANAQVVLETLDDQLPAHVVIFSIEEIGALGMAFWLSALAYGAGGITVWDAASHANHDWFEVQQEITKTNQMLKGLGYPEHMVNWLNSNDLSLIVTHLSTINSLKTIPVAQYAGIDDKRRMINFALEHLHQHAPSPVNVLTLSNEAAFGKVEINKLACTLCHACVTVCPVGALLDGIDKPQLNFIEDLCVQCGLCSTACPENAIELKPQYLFDRVQAREIKLLHDEPVFHCICCHEPFATQKMIDTMIDKLKMHAMFQGDALERLKMCKDCRVKALYNDVPGK